MLPVDCLQVSDGVYMTHPNLKCLTLAELLCGTGSENSQACNPLGQWHCIHHDVCLTALHKRLDGGTIMV